jgi:hypothetical protein
MVEHSGVGEPDQVERGLANAIARRPRVSGRWRVARVSPFRKQAIAGTRGILVVGMRDDFTRSPA